ncbi:unnamed protein product [Ceutorhynchus assimilis]|uniref:Phosphomevalonate kinase n=1 Tax=Ceutorhynchus assimilis TaxID=467358 RepID=A0A9N9MV77_9CUCU|nr:unnamed protein product [Ceutorhynchus assimilis]
MTKPTNLILLFTGKRKSGKDFICEKLKATLGDANCCIIRISGPLKRTYAENHQLDLADLMSDGPYKEQYRLDMINWSDEIRQSDPGYFCRAACEGAPNKRIWIVSDVRRKSDIKWFKENYNNIRTIRILADLSVREARGWKFTKGVDDVASECDLDDFNCWDIELMNNNNLDCENIVRTILEKCKEMRPEI